MRCNGYRAHAFACVGRWVAICALMLSADLVRAQSATQSAALKAYQDQRDDAQRLRDQVLALPDLPARAPGIVAQIRDNLLQERDAVQAGELRKAYKLHRLVARQLRRVSRYVQRRLRQGDEAPATWPRLRAAFERLTKHALALRDYARYEGLLFDAGPVKAARQAAKDLLQARQDLAATRAALRAYRDAIEQLEDTLKPIP